MAAQRKRQIPADVSQGSSPSKNPATIVNEEGKKQVAPELFTAMKEETLQILQEVEKTYSLNLCPRHTLTRDVQRRIDSLRVQEYVNTLWGRLRHWFHRFISLLTPDTEDDDDSEDDDNSEEDDDSEEDEDETYSCPEISKNV